MGFNTDVVVYHGSRADAFDAFSKDSLGSFTGSASAYMGFYFGSSRENSTSYSGGDPDNTKFKDLPALKEIQKAITDRCSTENIPRSFSVGMSSATAIPLMVQINDTNADIDDIKKALIDMTNQQLRQGIERGTEYITAYNAGEYKPKRDYNTPKFVADQLRQLTRQHEITCEVINGWSQPLQMKDWGWIGAYYLKMLNPYIVDQEKSSRASSFAEVVEKARADGHDGVIIYNTFDPKPTDVYVVFEPEQIRSVAATFDPRKANTPALMA